MIYCQAREWKQTPFFFLISKLRAAAQATESIEVAMNEPFSSLADSLC